MISLKQKKILAFPFSNYDAIICDGAVRSGKTSIMMVALVDWAMREFSSQRIGVCGKTVDSAVKNIILPYISMSYAKKRYSIRWRRSDKILEVSRGSVKNYFEVFGGKDESSFALIQGRTLAGVLLDEVALMPRSFVEQALARCSVDGSRFWFSCNPDAPTHWFKTEWIDKTDQKNALYIHFMLDDNPGLSEEIKKRYKSMYSGVFHRRYILGEWVRAEGVIWPLFADEPKRYEILKESLPKFEYITIGMDFGGNKSAHAIVATGITRDYRLYALRSVRIPSANMSVDQLITRFEIFAESIERDYGKIDYVYADSAEQSIINTLRQRTKYSIQNSVKGEIIDRIRTLDLLLATERWHYVADECGNLTDAMSTAVWDEKKLDDVRLDDGTTDIDSLDAHEYSWSAFQRHILRYGGKNESRTENH